jgi:hypothetical protein
MAGAGWVTQLPGPSAFLTGWALSVDNPSIITAAYQATKHELRLHVFRGAIRSWAVWTLITVLVMVIALGIVLMRGSADVLGFVLALLGVCAILSLLNYLFVRVPGRAARYAQRVNLAISGEGVRVEVPNVTAHYKWEAFSKVIQTRRFYYFQAKPPQSGPIIPRRALSAVDDQAVYDLTTRLGLLRPGKARP